MPLIDIAPKEPKKFGPTFDTELAQLVQKHMPSEGVSMICGDLGKTLAYLLSLNPDRKFVEVAVHDFMGLVQMYCIQNDEAKAAVTEGGDIVT